MSSTLIRVAAAATFCYWIVVSALDDAIRSPAEVTAVRPTEVDAADAADAAENSADPTEASGSKTSTCFVVVDRRLQDVERISAGRWDRRRVQLQRQRHIASGRGGSGYFVTIGTTFTPFSRMKALACAS